MTNPEHKTFSHKAAHFLGISTSLFSIVFTTRLIVDSGIRMTYPFIPQISKGLSMSISAFSWLLFVRSASSIFSPVFGVMADRYGRRKIMALAMLSQSVGMVGLLVVPQWWRIIPMILFGFGSNAFIPAQQAYVSDQVPFEKRGRAIASVDISFAVAGIFIMPIIGRMIENYGWQTPFIVLSILSLISAVVIWIRFPQSEIRTTSSQKLANTRRILLKPNVLASVGVGFLIFLAFGGFITIWSLWMSGDFGFDAPALGDLARSIGIAELLGAGLVGLLIDRLGKRRGSLISILILVVLLILMPLAQEYLNYVKIILILSGGVFEFVIIALFSLYAEQAPKARATLFSLVAVGNSLGMGLGAPIAAKLWEYKGLPAFTVFAVPSLILAAILIVLLLNEKGEY
ncbi:MAG: MFS transporter [Chloroflexota bacterium]